MFTSSALSCVHLQSTKVGIKANKLKAHEDSAVSQAAKECLRKWKKLAEEAGVSGSGTPRASELTKSESIGSAVSASETSVTSPKADLHSPSTGSASTLTASQDKSSSSSAASTTTATVTSAGMELDNPLLRLSTTRTRVKDALVKVFTEALTGYWAAHSDKTDEQMLELDIPRLTPEQLARASDATARSVEGAMFAILGGGHDDKPAAAYLDQFRLLAFNLKRNVPLTLNIFSGLVEPESVARYTSEDLVSDEAKVAAQKAMEEHAAAIQLDWMQKNKKSVLASAGLSAEREGTLVCKRCRSKNTEYTQRQTRSADEPMTT
jgi:transcription elongation factor S-II